MPPASWTSPTISIFGVAPGASSGTVRNTLAGHHQRSALRPWALRHLPGNRSPPGLNPSYPGQTSLMLVRTSEPGRPYGSHAHARLRPPYRDRRHRGVPVVAGEGIVQSGWVVFTSASLLSVSLSVPICGITLVARFVLYAYPPLYLNSIAVSSFLHRLSRLSC